MKKVIQTAFIILLLSHIVEAQQRVGINTNNPKANFHLAPLSTGSGSFLLGDSLNGPGNKVIWNHYRRAFRAGSTEAVGSLSLSWDEDSLGVNSAAFGYCTKATGNSSFATGLYSIARGDASISMGESSNALGNFGSIAQGYTSIANGGFGSIAIGFVTSAIGSHGTVSIGRGTRTTGNYGLVSLGYNCEATGNNGLVSIGYNNTVSGNDGSSAIGSTNWIVGNNSIALGTSNYISGDQSTALGYDNNTYGDGGSTTIGKNNTAWGNNGALALGINCTNDSDDGSAAIGKGNTTEGDFGSMAIGLNNRAIGSNGASALGNNNIAIGHSSIALGYYNKAKGDSGSIAMGNNNETKGHQSIALGYSNKSHSYAETVVGIMNDTSDYFSSPNPSAITGIDRLFTVGSGYVFPTTTRRNALVILKNGNMGIGENKPTNLVELKNQSGFTQDMQLMLNESSGGFSRIGFKNMGVLGWTLAAHREDNASLSSMNFYSNQLNGDVLSLRGDGTACFYGNVKANVVTTCSDVRYKIKIKILNHALDKLNNIDGVSYHYNTKDFPNQHFPSGEQAGLIAQQIEEVLPQVVYTDANGYKSVDYAKVVPLLVEAIKELKANMENEKMKTAQSLSKLEARINQLEALKM